jgi:hypothetical protein
MLINIYISNMRGGGKTPTSSVQTSSANAISAQNAISLSIDGNQASGTANIKTYEENTTVTIPPGGWFCDILMIGGGGGGNRSGAGAGACIVAIEQTLPAGTYVVSVGNGGGEYTSGGNSSISVGGNTIYLAKSGGTGGDVFANGADEGCGCGAGVLNGSTTKYDGGCAVATNIVNGIPSGPVVKNTYAVYGNSGGHQRDTNGTSPPTARYPPGYYAFPGGGGGIGDKGAIMKKAILKQGMVGVDWILLQLMEQHIIFKIIFTTVMILVLMVLLVVEEGIMGLQKIQELTG